MMYISINTWNFRESKTEVKTLCEDNKTEHSEISKDLLPSMSDNNILKKGCFFFNFQKKSLKKLKTYQW